MPTFYHLYQMKKITYTKQESSLLKKIGKQIRDARQNLGHTQQTLAKACKLDVTFISVVERGECNISLLNLNKIAKALKLPLSSIIEVSRLTSSKSEPKE